jgi:hypothetical protein
MNPKELNCSEQSIIAEEERMINKEVKKEFYKQYPDMFLENALDLKLHWYQKVFLRAIIHTNLKRTFFIRKIIS